MKGQYPIEERCSELTFNFWHALKVNLFSFFFFVFENMFWFQEEVTSSNEGTNQGVLLELFRPYFEHLIEVLISKGQLPENENVFTSEDKERFRAYRSDLIETMVNEKTQFWIKDFIWILDGYV